MPTRCVAVGCRNTANRSGKTATQMKFEKVMKITFHSFPSNPIRRAEWIRLMKLEDKIITNRSRLCSLHFKEEYIDRTSLVYVRLRENAIPHIFEDTLCDDVEVTMKNAQILTEPLNIKMEMEDNLEQDSVIHSVCDKETYTSLSLSSEIRKSTEDKETRISPERIWNMNYSNMEVVRQKNVQKLKIYINKSKFYRRKSGKNVRKLQL